MKNPNKNENTVEKLRKVIRKLNTEADNYEKEKEKLTKEKIEAEKELKKAKDFVKGKYESLIHDLFETPLKKLILKIQKGSLISIAFTLLIAVLSIGITFFISYYYQQKNETTTVDLITKMEKNSNSLNKLIPKINKTEKSLQETEITLKNISNNVSETNFMAYVDPKIVKEIVISIGNEKITDKNSLVLAYKIIFGRSYSLVRYEAVYQAFLSTGLDKDIAYDLKEIESWDKQFLALCENAKNVIDKKDENDLILDEDRFYNKYKVNTDNTDYTEAQFPKEEATYLELRQHFEQTISIINRRLNFNNN